MIPLHLYLASFPTGSNYICNPPVTNTDIDTMYLVSDMEKTYNELSQIGWTYNGKDTYPPELWASYRLGNNNALCTSDVKHFNAFLAATEEAKRLNLLDKADRIALFEKYTGIKQPKAKSRYQTMTMDDLIMPVPPPVLTEQERIDNERLTMAIQQMRDAQRATNIAMMGATTAN